MSDKAIYGLYSAMPLAAWPIIRYVGKTTRGIDTRHLEHLKHPARRVAKWIEETGTANVRIIVLESLPHNTTDDDIAYAEAKWIHHYTWLEGHPPLLNTVHSRRYYRAWLRAHQGPPGGTALDPKLFW